MKPATKKPTAKGEAELRALLERRKKIVLAKDDLIHFAEYVMPVPDKPDDMSASLYRPSKHHRVLGAALEKVEQGDFLRLQVTMPPRHGKTKLASHLFAAWYIGRHPENSMIVATYSEKFAWDHGRAVRNIIKSPLYKQIFPNLKLKTGSQSVDRLEIMGGGVLFFLGRGSGITGRGADVILLDDPLKDRREADSPTIREQLWSWYTQVLQTRLMTKEGAIVVIQTRWHEDDLIGRLTDPLNPCYVEAEAQKWRVIEMPALALKGDVLGRMVNEPLWPERFDRDYLGTIRQTDVRGFQALYQGRPTPEEGAFFQAKHFRPYKYVKSIPDKERLRFYCASDHAVSLKQGRDKTCLMAVGVDEHDQIWVMPDLFWRQSDTATVIEAMLVMMQKYHPVFWFSEKHHISQSIGPFLRKRMLEKRVFCSLYELVPALDKEQRAQSISGRISQQGVLFPVFASWWAEAYDQMIKFPSGVHDDFVDTLALIGLGLYHTRKPKRVVPPSEAPKQGTLAWVIEDSKREKKERKSSLTTGGW